MSNVKVEKQEPVAIYKGPIDCGEYGAFDLEMLKMIPRGSNLYTAPQPVEKQEPVATGVYEACNKNVSFLFATKESADEFASKQPTSAGIWVHKRQLLAYTAPQPCPECVHYISEIKRRQSEIDALRKERDELAAQVTHWKANHASVVEQARILKERPDMPIERVKAYESWVAMAVQVEKIRGMLAEVLNWNKDLDRPVLDAYVKSILALPDLYTGILNSVRAETLRKAADIFESQEIGSANMSSIRALAAAMEAGKCPQH